MKIVSKKVGQELQQRAEKPIRFNSLYAAVLVGLMQARRKAAEPTGEVLSQHTEIDRNSREE